MMPTELVASNEEPEPNNVNENLESVDTRAHDGKDGEFVAAEAIKYSRPLFPKKKSNRELAGAVELAYMVARDGSVYEVRAVRSTDADFEKSSINAAKRYDFKPATYNSVPVDSESRIVIMYEMEGVFDKVHPVFARRYSYVVRELKLENPNQSKLRKYLDNLARRYADNIYALVNMHYLEVVYARKFLSAADWLEALNKLCMFDSCGFDNYLSLEQKQEVFFQKLDLEMRLGHFAEGLETFARMHELWPEFAAQFLASMGEIRALIASGKVLRRELTLPERGSQFLILARSKFELDSIEGQIESLNLYCSRQFESMAYEPNKIYEVPESYGDCRLNVEGTAGTTYFLYER